MQVILMRGIPGAGKSTWIRKNTPSGTYVFSADQFFIHEKTGEYRFDSKKVGEAHNQCFKFFAAEVMKPDFPNDVIVVDNTNLMAWEIAPYYRLAEIFGAEVKIVRIHTPFEVAARRNLHGVPVEKVWMMWQTLLTEKLPPQWREEIMFSE